MNNMMNMTKMEKYFSANGYRFNISGENKTGRDFANFASAFKNYLESLCEEYTKSMITTKQMYDKPVTKADSAEVVKFSKGYFDVNAVIRFGDQYVNVFTPSVRLDRWEKNIVVRIMKNINDHCGGMNHNTDISKVYSTIPLVATDDAIYNINGKYYNFRKLIAAGNNVALLWGGSCNGFEVDYETKTIIFKCYEHNESFVTSIAFDELEKNI